MLPFTVHPVGDCALLAGFTQRIAPEIGAAVAALNSRVLAAKLPGVTETVPAFASLLVVYDPLVTDYDTLAAALQGLSDADGADTAAGEGRLVTIPVCYGGDFGPDLPFVAKHAGLTEAEVIALHTGREYRIYMLGFLPGFPYLGGLDERLFTPRLNTPRTAIPAGAVGIGGEQTGIYPMACKLAGTPLQMRRGADILSDGIVPGSVQVSADGQPIVMLADHQTMGGYAKIATVISADLPALAQLRPGQQVCFTFVTPSRAVQAARQQAALWQRVRDRL